MLDAKQHHGEWQHFQRGSRTGIPFMSPSVQPLQDAQLLCSWGHAASPRGRAHGSPLAQSPALWTSGYGTAEHHELRYKILLWPHLHMASSSRSPPYPALIALCGGVECEPGFTDLTEQASV